MPSSPDMPEYVNKLNNECQKHRKDKPDYSEKRSGPAHAETWKVTVTIGEIEYGKGEGSNRREAKANAAKEALSQLEQEVREAAAKEALIQQEEEFNDV